MNIITLFHDFSQANTKPTFKNLTVLLTGAILTNGPRTVTACIRAAAPWATKHFSAYENVLRRAKLNEKVMARILFDLILGLIPEGKVINLVVDDSLVRRYGPYVACLGVHRDPLRSSSTRKGISLGHKWVVLSIAIKLPFLRCAVALPILSELYVSKKRANRSKVAMKKKHRTPSRIALLLTYIAVRWAPERRFHLIGDNIYASHKLADTMNEESDCERMRAASLVSRMQLDAGLYEPPGPYSGKGPRKRVKGEKLPNPAEVAAMDDARWEAVEIDWYGSTRRKVLLLSSEGLWYRCGTKATRVRWVVVRDPAGKHRDECFFTTDMTMTPKEIVETYVLRWSIEVTFEETKCHLGLETLRNRSETAVHRSVPMLLALFSLIIVWYANCVGENDRRIGAAPWYNKQYVTFSDMIEAAREAILLEATFETDRQEPGVFFLAPYPWRLIYKLIAEKNKAA